MNNTIELVGHYGGDITHATSAWTSTTRDLTPEKLGRMNKLLTMLAKGGHHTPFEKSSLHFLVTTDIATHIQLLKHRIGVSINAESARYKELKDDKFYVPFDWDAEEQALYIAHMEQALLRYHETLKRLIAKGVSKKRAKESARMYLPYGNQIISDIMFNFRSFAHFIGLRYATDAQAEVRNLAEGALKIVTSLGDFKLSLEAFGFTKDGIIIPPFHKGE